MSQSNWIGAFIAIGFIAYIIANGQLAGYLSVLGITNTGQSGNTIEQTAATNTLTPAMGLSSLQELDALNALQGNS